ncbi:hypothetical protein BS78_08G072400 [Paspalum vaginatum]|nr:hypothetical protein BS78_08G072400 [Paspalum vaginatum]
MAHPGKSTRASSAMEEKPYLSDDTVARTNKSLVALVLELPRSGSWRTCRACGRSRRRYPQPRPQPAAARSTHSPCAQRRSGDLRAGVLDLQRDDRGRAAPLCPAAATVEAAAARGGAARRPAVAAARKGAAPSRGHCGEAARARPSLLAGETRVAGPWRPRSNSYFSFFSRANGHLSR